MEISEPKSTYLGTIRNKIYTGYPVSDIPEEHYEAAIKVLRPAAQALARVYRELRPEGVLVDSEEYGPLYIRLLDPKITTVPTLQINSSFSDTKENATEEDWIKNVWEIGHYVNSQVVCIPILLQGQNVVGISYYPSPSAMHDIEVMRKEVRKLITSPNYFSGRGVVQPINLKMDCSKVIVRFIEGYDVSELKMYAKNDYRFQAFIRGVKSFQYSDNPSAAMFWGQRLIDAYPELPELRQKIISMLPRSYDDGTAYLRNGSTAPRRVLVTQQDLDDLARLNAPASSSRIPPRASRRQRSPNRDGDDELAPLMKRFNLGK